MLVRNKENRNISVSKGHQYTVEKVRKAIEFVNNAGRNTKVQEWVEMYNYLRNADEKIVGCKPCAAAKYTASVRNYAHLGYLTLLNESHKPEEFGIGEKKVQEPIENKEKRIVLEEPKVEEPKEDVVIEEVKEALQEEPVTSENEVIVNEMSDVQDEVTEEPNVEEPQEEATEVAPLSEGHEESKSKRGRKSSK